MSKLPDCCLIALALLLPVPALAQPVFTVQPVNVRAGPDSVFPLVIWLPAQTPVQVVGCMPGGSWCDIVSGRTRGWVHSRYLGSFIRNRTPIVTFSVDTYWDAHFRGRPWYAERSAWVGWGTPGFQPPPPPPSRWRGSPRGQSSATPAFG